MKRTDLKTALIFTTVSYTALEKKIDATASTVAWTGKKLAGSHEGTIQLQEGVLSFTEEGELSGGEFIMNMNSIEVTDLTGESKEQLEGHLKNDDFFSVDRFNTSKLVITKAVQNSGNTYTVTGDLSIKGKTEPVTFDMEVNEGTAAATVVIDRTKYGIRYGSGSFFSNLGDNTIKNNFSLDVNLKF